MDRHATFAEINVIWRARRLEPGQGFVVGRIISGFSVEKIKTKIGAPRRAERADHC